MQYGFVNKLVIRIKQFTVIYEYLNTIGTKKSKFFISIIFISLIPVAPHGCDIYFLSRFFSFTKLYNLMLFFAAYYIITISALEFWTTDTDMNGKIHTFNCLHVLNCFICYWVTELVCYRYQIIMNYVEKRWQLD